MHGSSRLHHVRRRREVGLHARRCRPEDVRRAGAVHEDPAAAALAAARLRTFQVAPLLLDGGRGARGSDQPTGPAGRIWRRDGAAGAATSSRRGTRRGGPRRGGRDDGRFERGERVDLRKINAGGDELLAALEKFYADELRKEEERKGVVEEQWKAAMGASLLVVVLNLEMLSCLHHYYFHLLLPGMSSYLVPVQ